MALRELDDTVKADPQLITACVDGASTPEVIQQILTRTGFVDISIQPKSQSSEFIKDWSQVTNLEELVVSAYIEARKPQ